MLPRIPFDSFVLAAVVSEARRWVGARAQKIWQPDHESIVLELYLASQDHETERVAWLWIGWDAEFARAYLSPRKPQSLKEPPTFCMTLRARIGDARLDTVDQLGLDRILTLGFGSHTLVAELMGKHANAILLGPDDRVVTAAKVVPPTKSPRPVLPGRAYEMPPHSGRPSLLLAKAGDDLSTYQGASPFLRKLIEVRSLLEVQEAISTQHYAPVFVPNAGAYPVSVAPLGYQEVPRSSISVALANYYDVAIPTRDLERRRSALLTQLRRVELARETAVADLENAQEAGARAGLRQRMGELILAYQSQVAPGAITLDVLDYDGSALTIPLDPEKTAIENATKLFEKAKRTKARAGLVADQLLRQRSDLSAVRALIAEAEVAASLPALADTEERATRRRWLIAQRAPVDKEDRPFQGHKIRELLGPAGWVILVGENSEANDYLTLRVAKPDDWWFHVRGATSAHVVVPTRKHPEKVPREVLEFAAELAVKHSGQKHASYVPVDYTLKRYVRKVRGAPAGTVVYTHEKTLHVDHGS